MLPPVTQQPDSLEALIVNPRTNRISIRRWRVSRVIEDARFPALFVLEPKLADTATVVFDDVNRQDEQAALRRWTETFEGLAREREVLGRHAVLSYARSGRPMTTVGS